MQRAMLPFNIELLVVTEELLRGLRPVKVLDIMDTTGANFHEDGLFSSLTFGKVGERDRFYRFSYIDIKVPILHPIIFRALTQLKELYSEILAGKAFAIYNDDVKDFIRSNPVEGSTGFQFFMQHFNDLSFTETKSIKRQQLIDLIYQYKDVVTTTKVVVIPAALRDIEIASNNQMTEDEINKFYRKMLAISNTITEAAVKNNPEILNTSRYNLQLAFNGLYDFLESMIDGKKKLIAGKWASRNIFNGTRNVITAMNTATNYFGDPGNIRFNNTVIGIYQMSKAILPVTLYHLRTGFLREVFQDVNQPVKLVNKKTRKLEERMLKPKQFDRWATNEGLEQVLTAFKAQDARHQYLEINGCYLGLIYKGPDNTFRLMHSIDELPDDLNPDFVVPLTFVELIYTAMYRHYQRYPLMVTRYPITGVGSIYPSFAYVKTTVDGEKRAELGPDWKPLGDKYVAYQFPIYDAPFVNSLVPHSAKLVKLGADFDGDTSSANALYTEDSIREISQKLKQASAYIGTDGKLISSFSVNTVNLVLNSFTGDPK